jgi:hypothetical protein
MPKSGSFVDRRAEFDVLEAVPDLLDGLDDGEEYSDVLAAFFDSSFLVSGAIHVLGGEL